MWIGAAFAQQPSFVFPIIVCGFALLGLNVTAHYALLAVGHVRVVTYLSLIAGVAMLLLMALLIPRHGVQGAALARLLYGPITCLAYFQVYRIIWRGEANTRLPQPTIYKIVASRTD